MTNLKKVLSVLLALTMALTLSTAVFTESLR